MAKRPKTAGRLKSSDCAVLDRAFDLFADLQAYEPQGEMRSRIRRVNHSVFLLKGRVCKRAG